MKGNKRNTLTKNINSLLNVEVVLTGKKNYTSANLKNKIDQNNYFGKLIFLRYL